MRKGRNKDLITKRDEALLRKYYQLTEIERCRFDDTLKILSEQEFFLSEERIITIIRKNLDLIKEIALKPIPKVKKPRITASQLAILKGKDEHSPPIG